MEDGNIVEMPFWVWEEGGQRKKLYADVANDMRINILCEERAIAHFAFDDNTDSSNDNLNKLRSLISNGTKIRPKAIANTMYSRMFFSDLFVHGIGGAKYDLITDEIIKDFFGVEPPSYTTTSATLHLPYKPFDASNKDVKALEQTIKDMGYNPDRYASTEIMENAEMISMISEKRELIAKETHDAKEKHQTFDRIKQLNSLMKDKISHLIKEKEKELEDLGKKIKYNSIVANREYPFCIYPEEMLGELFTSDKNNI